MRAAARCSCIANSNNFRTRPWKWVLACVYMAAVCTACGPLVLGKPPAGESPEGRQAQMPLALSRNTRIMRGTVPSVPQACTREATRENIPGQSRQEPGLRGLGKPLGGVSQGSRSQGNGIFEAHKLHGRCVNPVCNSVCHQRAFVAAENIFLQGRTRGWDCQLPDSVGENTDPRFVPPTFKDETHDLPHCTAYRHPPCQCPPP